MARRPKLDLRGVIDSGRHKEAVDRHFSLLTAPPSTSPDPEEAARKPKGVGGVGGSATGFGRRAVETDYDQVQWSEDAPYPQIATRSSNPERPRTLEAGYDPESNIVRVTFREGAIYEYIGVPEHTWETFRRAPSPGRMINSVMNQFFYRRIN